MRERRVHHDTGGFIHGEQTVVFVEHFERDRFGRHRRSRRRLGQLNRDAIPERRPGGHAADGRAVDGDQTACDPRLHARARRVVDIGEMSPQHEIETAARVTAIGVDETVHVWEPEPQCASFRSSATERALAWQAQRSQRKHLLRGRCVFCGEMWKFYSADRRG
jgi:hypothetical protein